MNIASVAVRLDDNGPCVSVGRPGVLYVHLVGGSVRVEAANTFKLLCELETCCDRLRAIVDEQRRESERFLADTYAEHGEPVG